MRQRRYSGFAGSALLVLALLLTVPDAAGGEGGEVLGGEEAFNASLGRYVKEGVVDYTGWARDLDGLNRFVDFLEEVELESLSPDEKKALFINAYNAFMLRMIFDHYPLKSVFEIKPDPFKQKRFNLGGDKVSLDHIEHEMLRKMGDARIHFAIVCASRGCPDQASEVYRAERLDEQLDKAARRYFSQDKGLVVEGNPPRRIRVSKILEWFGKDFGRGDEEKVRFITRFAPKEWKASLEKGADSLSLGYLDYDWSLNGQ